MTAFEKKKKKKERPLILMLLHSQHPRILNGREKVIEIQSNTAHEKSPNPLVLW